MTSFTSNSANTSAGWPTPREEQRPVALGSSQAPSSHLVQQRARQLPFNLNLTNAMPATGASLASHLWSQPLSGSTTPREPPASPWVEQSQAFDLESFAQSFDSAPQAFDFAAEPAAGEIDWASLEFDPSGLSASVFNSLLDPQSDSSPHSSAPPTSHNSPNPALDQSYSAQPSSSSLQAFAQLQQFQLYQRERDNARSSPSKPSASSSPSANVPSIPTSTGSTPSLLTRQIQQAANGRVPIQPSTSPKKSPSASFVPVQVTTLPTPPQSLSSSASVRRVASGRKPAEGTPGLNSLGPDVSTLTELIVFKSFMTAFLKELPI